jgi:hypothetical protein
MDFVTAWKAISIALTGAFGILGLLTEFKDKETKKITKWGWISLVGIVVSSAFGVAAQFKESSNDAAKSLTLAHSMDRTLNEIHRELSSLATADGITIAFEVPCSQDKFVAFCRELTHSMAGKNEGIPSFRWKHSPFPQSFSVRVGFLPKNATPKDYEKFNFPQNTNLDLFIEGPPRRKDASFYAWVTGYDSVEVFLKNQSLRSIDSDGTILSLFDLHGTRVVVGPPNPLFDDLSLTRFYITLKDGEKAGFDVDGTRVEVRRLRTPKKGSMYIFDLPLLTSQSNESSAAPNPGTNP